MDNLLTFLYWFLGIIAFLFAVGLGLCFIGAGIAERGHTETNDAVSEMKHKFNESPNEKK